MQRLQLTMSSQLMLGCCLLLRELQLSSCLAPHLPQGRCQAVHWLRPGLCLLAAAGQPLPLPESRPLRPGLHQQHRREPAQGL